MTSKFRLEGDQITYSNSGSAIAVNSVVVIGNRQCGVAIDAIAATTGVGEVALEGIFELTKHNSGNAFTLGQRLWWDASGAKLYNAPAAGYYFIGYAARAAGATDTTGFVQLAPFVLEGPRVLTLSSATTLSLADFAGGNLHVQGNTQSAAFTITLPAAATITGAVLSVRRTGTGTNAITLDGNASETVGGSATFATLDAAGDFAQFRCDGSNWLTELTSIA